MMTAAMCAARIQHLGIVGVGLIGGSIGAAVRSRGLAETVTGLGRSVSKLQGAVDEGILDDATDDVCELSDCDFVVVATPVDRIVGDVQSFASCCRSAAFVTDAGSVKASICDGVSASKGIRFVGSHPLAGSERTGFAHADANLFQDRVCVVTPNAATDADALRFVQAFWESIGMRVIRMSPDEHDRRLARTSHLPHLTAAALSFLLESADRPLTSTGFRDTTRIAAGDPELWRAIFSANSEAMLQETDRLIDLLTQWRDWMAKEDWLRLTKDLRVAKEAREALRTTGQ